MSAWDDPAAHIRGLERKLAAIEAVASKVKREADEQWTAATVASDTADIDAANRHSDIAEILDETNSDLRAALETP